MTSDEIYGRFRNSGKCPPTLMKEDTPKPSDDFEKAIVKLIDGNGPAGVGENQFNVFL